MKIQKRNGQYQAYDAAKILAAITKALESVNENTDLAAKKRVVANVEKKITEGTPVETIQDDVEEELMKQGYLKAAKAYILYRQKHLELRKTIDEFVMLVKDPNIGKLLSEIQKEFPQEEYSLQLLLSKFKSFYKLKILLTFNYLKVVLAVPINCLCHI